MKFPKNTLLTTRERYCVQISSQLANFRKEEVLVLLHKGLVKDKLSVLFFEEVMIHLSLVLGYPTLIEGMSLLSQVKTKAGYTDSHRSSPLNRNGDGIKVLKKIYGNQTERMFENLSKLNRELPGWITSEVYGKVFTRRGLLLKERELINVTVLFLQGYQKQLFSHIRGSLRVDIKKRSLIKILEWLGKEYSVDPKDALDIVGKISK